MADKLLKDILGTGDFDMDEYDKAMAATFDDEYYKVHSCFPECGNLKSQDMAHPVRPMSACANSHPLAFMVFPFVVR